ncbi:MAG: hypothetical protein JST00_32095 [Deltaproteobacteria bacterium]|nr:hypothetical protein [Deltaproteobacteria bacterium]
MTQPGFPSYGGPGGAPYGPPSGRPSLYGSIPPISHPSIPPNPHRPSGKTSILPFAIGGGVALLALIAFGGGVAAYKLRSKSVALPVDVKMLPAQTSEVSTQLIDATREKDERIKRAYLAAELGSEMCLPGSGDPARRIEGLGGGTTRAAKELFFQKKSLDDIRAVMDCGSALAESLESPYQAVITVEGEAAKRQRIAVGHFGVSTLPAKHGFTPFSFRGQPGYCRTSAPNGTPAFNLLGTCEESTPGAFAQGTTWFLGDRASLETMAQSVRAPKEELNARLLALKDAAAQTEGLPVVRLQAQPKTSRDFFMAPCFFGASQSAAPFTSFLDGCFPAKGQERLIEEIDSKIKAAAYETDGDVQKAGAFKGNLVFVARDDAGAKEVELDVKEIVSEWKSHVELNDARLINQSNDFAFTTRQKKFAAVADRYFAALKHAKVSRSGRTVRVSFSEKLTKADLLALDDADRKTIEKRRATAEILEAIQSSRPIPAQSLSKIVGAPWAMFLSGPPPKDLPNAGRAPMPKDECKVVQSRLAAFTTASFASSDARLLFLTYKFASCDAFPPSVDAAQRICLAAFKTPVEFAKCTPANVADAPLPGQPPESEFGDRRPSANRF